LTATSSIGWGAFYSIVASGCTSAVDAYAKVLGSELHGLVIVWGYTVALFTVLLPYLAYKFATEVSRRNLLSTRRLPLQLLRSACLVGSIGTLFVSLRYVPLVDATAVMFTSPLFVNLLAGPILGEKVSLQRWLGVLAGLAGVLIIMRPGASGFHWAILLSVLAAVSLAIFQIASRSLASSERTLTTLFYTAAGSAFWSSCLVVFVWQPLDSRYAFVFLSLGAIGVAAHFSYIRAAEVSEASFLAPFIYTKIVWTAVLGYLLFEHVPGPALWLGSSLIIGGGLYVYLKERVV